VGYLALVFVAVHLIALGLTGWMAPAGWTAGAAPDQSVGLRGGVGAAGGQT